MPGNVTGSVLSVERCSLHDGPGLRTTVFLKGCPLRCLWCHNPESQSFKPELYFLSEKCIFCGLCASVCFEHRVNKKGHTINRDGCKACGRCAETCPNNALEIKGNAMTSKEVLNIVLKDKKYYTANGGLTVSGGEPLAQSAFTLDLLRIAKENRVHTCLETSGYAAPEKLLSVVPYVDLFLYDFKESDEENHKKYTGAEKRLIMDNLFAIGKTDAKIILRCPIVPTVNERDGHFTAIAETANQLKNIIEINIMPYHSMGASKAARIGKEYPLSVPDFTEDEKIDNWINKVKMKTSINVKRG